MSRKIILLSIFSLIFISGCFFLVNSALAEPDKEYRSGQIIAINGKNYLIASNKEFAEILEITADNKLYQVSEVHGAGNIEDLSAGKYLNKYYLVVATGRYLYRYDISDPAAPKIEFKRDLYVFKRGQFRIGSVNILAENDNFIFGAGSNGVRSFYPDNLFLSKIYAFDKSYGVAASDSQLAVITETKGTIYDIASGNKLAEVDLENKDKMIRQPYFDAAGYAYFPSDRGLVKIFGDYKKSYNNPVPNTENFSYGVASLRDGNIYYVNGHGITMLDKNFSKLKFLNTSKARFGTNSWAVGITAAEIGSRDLVIEFNKSSILLLDKNLNVLSQYKYKKLYPDFISFNLKISPSVNLTAPGQRISLQLFGFWPNETVDVSMGVNRYQVKADNQGYGQIVITVPSLSGNIIIQATGQDSKFNYQTVLEVL